MSDLSDLPEADLIEDIKQFCERRDISVREFGRQALNDTGFVARLQKGRECLNSTRRRIQDFMAQ